MKLVDLLTELLALVTAAPPAATEVRAAISNRDLSPAVHTINVRDDVLGRGTYAELVIDAPARIRDIASVVGELRPAPRSPADSMSGQKLVASINRGENSVQVFVELAFRSTDRIAYVTIHYKPSGRS